LNFLSSASAAGGDEQEECKVQFHQKKGEGTILATCLLSGPAASALE
jgi:hypothetical protein